MATIIKISEEIMQSLKQGETVKVNTNIAGDFLDQLETELENEKWTITYGDDGHITEISMKPYN